MVVSFNLEFWQYDSVISTLGWSNGKFDLFYCLESYAIQFLVSRISYARHIYFGANSTWLGLIMKIAVVLKIRLKKYLSDNTSEFFRVDMILNPNDQNPWFY